MPTTPCEVISGLVEAMNARDEKNLAACFCRQATVRDGGLEYRGSSAIRRWMQDAFDRYALHLDVTEVSGQGKTWFFQARVSGNFEGSPVKLEHSLTIEDGKIANLEI
jgi:ketosteroid isomerase-like protein